MKPSPIRNVRGFRPAAGYALPYALIALAVGLDLAAPLDLAVGRAVARALLCAVSNGGAAMSILLAGEISLVYAALLSLLCLAFRRPRAAMAVLAGLFATAAIELLSKYLFAANGTGRGVERGQAGRVHGAGLSPDPGVYPPIRSRAATPSGARTSGRSPGQS